MIAQAFYDETADRKRTLRDGDGVRNVHNFIKACLIEEWVPLRAHLLDLGCGQGGDLRKFARRQLKSYVGIDVSHASLQAHRRRMAEVPAFRCRTSLQCMDFCTARWARAEAYDAVSVQFALQYAFASEAAARGVLAQAAASLRPGGVLLGTIPVHAAAAAFEQIMISLPGDLLDRACIEYNAPRDALVGLAVAEGLRLVLWSSFDAYYAAMRDKRPGLAARMRALGDPLPDNAVFVFEKPLPHARWARANLACSSEALP